MAGPWFRFYAEVLNDPKIIRLTDKEFRAWVLMLCIAAENDGKIDTEDLTIRLRMPDSKVASVFEGLLTHNLIDQTSPGWATPHNWNARQYKSDVSTARVKRFRERHETVSETPPDTEAETEQIQSRTETDADAEIAPAHPFALAYVKRYQERHAGQRPPQTEHAAALSLEREYGASSCIQLGNDLDWSKHPNYMRPILEERRNGNTNRTNGGKQTAGVGSAQVATGVSELERRRAALAERRRVGVT